MSSTPRRPCPLPPNVQLVTWDFLLDACLGQCHVDNRSLRFLIIRPHYRRRCPQVFLDGNKRAAILFANHYLIAHGGGLLVVPESDVAWFKKLLRFFSK